MAQSQRESSYRCLDASWNGPTQDQPVPWTDWTPKFQLVVIAKEERDNDHLFAENSLPENVYPTLEELIGSMEAQVRTERETRNKTALRIWRREETCRLEEKKRLFNGYTRGEGDKKVKSKLFLSLVKQGQRYFNKKRPRTKL